jgi:hypothetical protein
MRGLFLKKTSQRPFCPNGKGKELRDERLPINIVDQCIAMSEYIN